jgi:hypothetical protein
MHKVIEANFQEFVRLHELGGLNSSQQFERFVNYCVLAQHFREEYDINTVTTGDDDPGIDGVAVFFNDELISTAESATDYFNRLAGRRRSIVARYVFVQAKQGDSFDLGEMLKFSGGVYGVFSAKSKPSDDALAEFSEIHDVVVQNLMSIEGGRPKIDLYYACTGVWTNAKELQARGIEAGKDQLNSLGLFTTVEYTPVDREKLISLWVKTSAPVEATFVVKGAVPLPAITGVSEAYLTLTLARDFVRNVLSDTNGNLRTNVFDQNVRAFLGDDNPVNARITQSLKDHTGHDRFAINNNGITIVSPDVRVQSDRISVSDFQIVNGCQTSHVLFRNQDSLTDSVWIPIKVIEAEEPNVIAQVVQATNSQSLVADSQFLSIIPFTQRVEVYFNAFDADDEQKERRLYFERRTNQYAGAQISKARIFDIYKLSRAFASMFLDIPHIAYMYPTQVLEQRRKDLFQAEHREHAYYSAAHALYRLELCLGNKYVPTQYQSYKWHILMLVKYLTAGGETPRLESPKIENYAAKIDRSVEMGGKASAAPFLQAVDIIESVGTVTRDRRKVQRYTDELKKAALDYVQRKAPKRGSGKA